MYEARVQGAPEKPISGTLPASPWRIMRTASITNGIVSWGSGTTRRATSRAVRTGLARTGPLASVNSTGHAHRLDRDQDVGEEDRRVDAELLDGQQGDLRRELRLLAQLHERVLLAHRAVLRLVAPGLAHDPDRRAPDLAAAAGFEKVVGRRWRFGAFRHGVQPLLIILIGV